MYFNKIIAAAAVAVASVTGVLAVPAPTRTADPKCPQVYSYTTTDTLFLIAETYTGPITTETLTITGTSYPLATTTEAETWNFSGTVWVGSPTYTVEVTEFLTTNTGVFVYENYFNNPPYPSDCTVF